MTGRTLKLAHDCIKNFSCKFLEFLEKSINHLIPFLLLFWHVSIFQFLGDALINCVGALLPVQLCSEWMSLYCKGILHIRACEDNLMSFHILFWRMQSFEHPASLATDSAQFDSFYWKLITTTMTMMIYLQEFSLTWALVCDVEIHYIALQRSKVNISWFVSSYILFLIYYSNLESTGSTVVYLVDA